MTTEEPTNTQRGELKRIRVKKERQRKKRREARWFYRYGPDVLLLLLLASGLGLLLLLLVPSLAPAGIPGLRRLLSGGTFAVLAAVFLATALIGGALRLRWRVLHRSAWWNTACPRCSKNDLRRMQRYSRDRLLGRLGVPVRRYICADCHWRGARIDRTRI